MPVADHVNLVKLSHPLGRHVGVFGAGGKSTLASAIARNHNLEFIELDWIQHIPGWQRRPDEEVEKIVTERMHANPRGWVTDHNFRFIWQRAESVIVLELPFRTVFWRRFKRTFRTPIRCFLEFIVDWNDRKHLSNLRLCIYFKVASRRAPDQSP